MLPARSELDGEVQQPVTPVAGSSPLDGPRGHRKGARGRSFGTPTAAAQVLLLGEETGCPAALPGADCGKSGPRLGSMRDYPLLSNIWASNPETQFRWLDSSRAEPYSGTCIVAGTGRRDRNGSAAWTEAGLGRGSGLDQVIFGGGHATLSRP